jgi:glycosyltransferase involved in cell wall biosynthesis
MVEKAAYIISLKFAPGLKKEFEVLGENMARKGMTVKYLLSENYKKLEGIQEDVTYVSTQSSVRGMIFDTLKHSGSREILKMFLSYPPKFICIYNPHTLNPHLAKNLKKHFPNAVGALYLHDPHKPDKKPYGFLKSTYIRMAESVQSLTIKYMDYIISPSEYSSQLFRQRYPKFKGQNYIAPLLIPDKKQKENKSRRFFSIVGGAHLATGHDTFVELVNYVAEQNMDYEFALISSSNIEVFINKLSEKAKKILKVINKKIINDSEINEIIRESYTIFRLDREVTQSGVIPVSYMNETPVIARAIPGLTQHVWHEKTGYIVPFDCSPEDLVKAMDYVRNNFTELSMNARKSYEDIWAEWNFDKYYGWLVEILKNN